MGDSRLCSSMVILCGMGVTVICVAVWLLCVSVGDSRLCSSMAYRVSRVGWGCYSLVPWAGLGMKKKLARDKSRVQDQS